jgi:hypothetical protein
MDGAVGRIFNVATQIGQLSEALVSRDYMLNDSDWVIQNVPPGEYGNTLATLDPTNINLEFDTISHDPGASADTYKLVSGPFPVTSGDKVHIRCDIPSGLFSTNPPPDNGNVFIDIRNGAGTKISTVSGVQNFGGYSATNDRWQASLNAGSGVQYYSGYLDLILEVGASAVDAEVVLTVYNPENVIRAKFSRFYIGRYDEANAEYHGFAKITRSVDNDGLLEASTITLMEDL